MSFRAIALRGACSIDFFLFFLKLSLCRVKVIGHKCVGKLVPGNRHGEQFWNSSRQKGLFKNLPHTRTLLRLLDQHLCNDAFQVVRISWRDRWVISAENLQHKALHRVGVKSVSQSYHFIENTTKRPNIGLLVVRLLLTNLRWQVVWSTNSCLRAIISVLEDASDSEIANLDLAALCHENVLGFQIAMKDFPVVNMLDSKGHLDEPVQNLIFTVAN